MDLALNNQRLICHKPSQPTNYIYIHTYIIMTSWREHGFPLLSLSIRFYHPSYSAGSLDCILCLYRTVVDKFLPDVQHLLIRVKEPTGERRLWARPTSPAVSCFVRLILIVLEMGGRWPYTCSFVGCCFRDLFNMIRSILVQLPSSFFPMCFVSVHVVHPYGHGCCFIYIYIYITTVYGCLYLTWWVCGWPNAV